MPDLVKQLINDIIVAARERDLTQRDLAKRAGLTAVGLSKAKHRGDIRASTLAALAAQVDLQLALVPVRPGRRAAEAIRTGTFFRTGAPAADTGD